MSLPDRRALPLLTALIAAATLTGCASPAPAPSVTPTPTSDTALQTAPTATPPVPTTAPPSREGQPADGGSFAPLVVPAGVRFGVRVMPAVLTAAGSHLVVGDVALVDGTQCDMTTPAGLMISVDSISEPITGPDREQALGGLGYDAGTAQIVQQIVIRIRQIGGSDPGTTWSLADAVTVPNYAYHEPMPLYAPAGNTPLDGHGVSTGDTVQIVLYAAGTPDELSTTPLEAVQLHNGCRSDRDTVSIESPYLGDLVGGDE